MSTREIVMKKKVGGVLTTLYPMTKSNLIKVGNDSLDTELGNIKQAIIDNVPVGTVTIWFGNAYPDDWLPLDGQAISRSTYSELYGIYGTTFGSGDGSTTFNLPNQNSSDTAIDNSIKYKFIVKAIGTSIASTASVMTLSLNEDDNVIASSYTESSSNTTEVLLSLPVGTVIDYAGDTLPDNYLYADGRALRISEYSDLYSVIGTKFNLSSNTDTSTYFNIPYIEDEVEGVHKIIKVSGVNNLTNVIDNNPNNVVDAKTLQGLLNRIQALEEALGI